MKAILDIIHDGGLSKDAGLLISLVDKIRPSKVNREEEVIEQLENLIALLKSYPSLKHSLAQYIFQLFKQYDPVFLYTQSGILSGRGFINELWKKSKHKILPERAISSNTGALLNQIFHKSNDFKWVERVPKKLWLTLFNEFDLFGFFSQNGEIYKPLISAIQALSHNLVTNSLDADIHKKLPYLDNLDSPFLLQNKTLTIILESLSENYAMCSTDIRFDEVIDILEDCTICINSLREKKGEFGTSLHLTYITKRILQQIDRLILLVKVLKENRADEFNTLLIEMGIKFIKAENRKTSISLHFSENIDLLAFEIVEHSARKGGKYIADNAKEYWRYLRASMLGGLIIAIFAMFKIWFDGYDISPIGQGILFSLNYALCFILVEMLGGIIATKQPAMTASTLVKSIDNLDETKKKDLKRLKNLIIKVSRSQFIAFVGNLICAFPIAYLLSKGIGVLSGAPFISTLKEMYLVESIHPVQSGALFYASIAGIFLALAGLISGYFDNKVVFSQIGERIEEHPVLIRRISTGRLKKLSRFVHRYSGVVAGNVSLGFLLGMAGTIGFITGLPFDIRHIAFSSANLGFAFEFLLQAGTSAIITASIMGILGIGLLNFLVSFGLTLVLAMKSRNITFSQTGKLCMLLFKHFIRYPFDFFIPPRGNNSLRSKLKTSKSKRTEKKQKELFHGLKAS